MKRKAAELKSLISELETTKRRLIAEVRETPKGEKEHDSNTDGSRAGTAFGGRAEKAAGQ